MIDRSRGLLPAIRDLIIDDEATPVNAVCAKIAIVMLGGILAMWIWTLT